MQIPVDFPADVKSKLSIIDVAIKKNNASSEAIRKTLTNDDYRKAMEVVGVDLKQGTKSTLATDSPVTTTETFFSKYKYYIVVGVVVIVTVILYFKFKK